KDPDDIMREEGPGALKAAIDRTRPLVELLWERELEKEPVDTPERRAGLKRRLFEAVNAIQDETVRDEYRAELLARYDALVPRGRPAAGKWQDRTGRPGRRGARDLPARPSPELKSRAAAGKGGGPALRTLL